MSYKQLLLIGAIAAISLMFSQAASADGYVEWDLVNQRPSYIVYGVQDDTQSTIDYSFGCFDFDTGDPINCRVTFTLYGLEDKSDTEVTYSGLTDLMISGGHDKTQHSTAHPFYERITDTTDPGVPYLNIDPQDGNIKLNNLFTNAGPFSVSFDTYNPSAGLNYGDVTYAIPPVSGASWSRSDMVLPPGWVFIGPEFKFGDYRIHETDVAGIGGLQLLTPFNLQSTSPPYVVSRNLNPVTDAHPGDPGHGTDALNSDGSPNLTQDFATWGTPTTLQVAQSIAAMYTDLTPWHGTISVNDVSLPYGGLFDTKDNYNLTGTPKHQDHRFGRAFDVNTQDANGQVSFCDSSQPHPLTWLEIIANEEDAVRQDGGKRLYSSNKPEPVHCESPNFHLNIYTFQPLELAPINANLPPPVPPL